MAQLARRHGGPVATAVVLALLAVLPTAATVFTASGPTMSIDHIERRVPSPAEAIGIVIVTLVLTALASGWIGGLVRRRLRVTGASVALVGAWLLGALLLPATAAVLGVELRVAVVCFDTCDAMLDSAEPGASLLGVLLGMVIMVVTVVGAIVPGLLAVGAIVLAGRGHPTGAVACVAIAFGVLNVLAFAFVDGAAVPYLCLAIGVVAWSRWLDRRAEAPAPAQPTVT